MKTTTMGPPGHLALALLASCLLVGLGACNNDDDGPFDGGIPPSRLDLGVPPSQGGDDAGAGGSDDGGMAASVEIIFPSAAVSLWYPFDIARIARSSTNTLPELNFDGEVISDDYYIWDFWPLRNKDGTIATFGQQTILIALSAPRAGNTPGERHGVATWRYFYSTSSGWVDGGRVFAEGTAVGGRQWAGDAVYDPSTGRATFFYTALGMLEPLPDGSESPTNPADGYEDARRTGPSIVRQQIVSTTAQLNRVGETIQFQGFTPHEVILDADGDFYATAELARDQGALYVFRDPWYLEDPESDRKFLLFAGAAGFDTGPKSGVVGLAIWDEARSEWRLLPPILAGMETNSQLERPHMVHKNGRYFLFFSSHEFTFGAPNRGPEGLYGFYAENLRGRYTPLNEGGLVLANPTTAALQTYSYYVLPGGAVTSFINYINLGDVTLSGIGMQTRAWQKEHFGGTPAKPFFIDIGSDSTSYVDEQPPSRVLPSGVEAFVDALEGDGS